MHGYIILISGDWCEESMIQVKRSRYKDQNEWFVNDMDPWKECQITTIMQKPQIANMKEVKMLSNECKLIKTYSEVYQIKRIPANMIRSR